MLRETSVRNSILMRLRKKKQRTQKTKGRKKLLNPASLLEALFCLLTVLKGAEGFSLHILCVHILILQWGRFGRRRVRVSGKTLIFFVNAAADSSKFQFIVDFLQYFCNVMLLGKCFEALH